MLIPGPGALRGHANANAGLLWCRIQALGGHTYVAVCGSLHLLVCLISACSGARTSQLLPFLSLTAPSPCLELHHHPLNQTAAHG